MDGTAYGIAGDEGNDILNGTAVQQTAIFTPTSTTFTLKTGPMTVNITYLSPIEVSLSRNAPDHANFIVLAQ